jgi:geranylgeranyl pyrophosphate synthase
VDIEKDGEQQKLLIDILSCVELLHTASLVLDDIADGSTMRRGIPCIHHEFGYGIGVNAGIDLLFHPFRQFVRYRPNEASKYMKDYLDEVAWLFTGQSLDAAFHVDTIISEEKNYNEIALCKTGLFPRLNVKMIFSSFSNDEKLKEEMIAITNRMFLIHQIKDDIANITDSALARAKGVIGDDLTEGKMTLMVIKTLQTADTKSVNRLKEIMVSNTRDQGILFEGINIMRDCGAIAYTENKMKEHYTQVKARIEKLGDMLDKSKHDITAIEELLEYLHLLLKLEK